MNFGEIKSTFDRMDADLERLGEEAVATKNWREKLDGVLGRLSETLVKELEAQGERIEELESQRSVPGKGGGRGENAAARKAFNQFLHTNDAKVLESKDFSIVGGEATGSGAVPTEIAREIQSVAFNEEPILREIRITPATTGDYRRVTNRKGVNSGWVGEAGTRTKTDTSALRNIVPVGGELYAYPVATEWAVQDFLFDIAELVIGDAGEEFATQQARALFLGTGAGGNMPLGILNTTPVVTADTIPDTRDKDTLRYVTSEGSPNVLDGDLLITALFDLRAGYRRNAVWCMNSVTLAACRKLKDLNGRYLWENGGFSAGVDAPDGFLLGKKVVVCEQLQNVGAGSGNFPIVVGDFKRGYEMVGVGGMRITLDASITQPGFVKWYIRQRFPRPSH